MKTKKNASVLKNERNFKDEIHACSMTQRGARIGKNVPVVIIRLLFMVDNNFQIVHPENNTSYKTIGFW